MDLTKFLIKKSALAQERIQKHLQNILERPSRPHPFEIAAYVTQTDLSSFKKLDLDPSAPLAQKIEILFSQLSPFFEAGVLFKRQQTTWSPIIKFEYGFERTLEGHERSQLFTFPDLSIVEVKKTESTEILEKVGLGYFSKNSKISTLLMQPEKDSLILIISQLADPWLKSQVSEIQSTILSKIMDDTL